MSTGGAVSLLSLVACLAVQASTKGWRLDRNREANLNEVLRAAIDRGDLPGVVLLVTSKDRILYHRSFGSLDPDRNQPLTPGALFHIASMTKPVTSLGIMMLVEEGKIQLDAAASSYLPELKDRRVFVRIDEASGTLVTRPASREITIRDLLRHTSGLGYAFSSHELRAIGQHTRIPARERPLVHDPGARWTYGMGTAHLGWILERLTGLSLIDFFRRRIFEPLEMRDTSFQLSRERMPLLMRSFERREDRLVVRPQPAAITATGAGDGDLISTAADYARFVQLILSKGEWKGKRLLSKAGIAEMTRNQLGGLHVVEQPAANPSLAAAFPLGAGTDGFSLGFQVAAGGGDGRPGGSLSWAGIQNTHFWIDPQNEIGVVFLTQVLPFYDPRVIAVLRQVERTIYQQSPRK